MAEKKASLILRLKDNASAGLKRVGSAVQTLRKHWLGITAAIAAVTVVAFKSLKAFAIQEKAEILLAKALENTQNATGVTLAELKKYASQLQKVTTVGDETSLGLMQLGLSMGIQADQIKESTKQAIGFSKAYKVDLMASMKMIALARQGEFSMLARYIPQLRGMTDKTKMAALANKQFADGFSLAQEETKTMEGQIDQLKNSFGDLQEAIGKFLSGPAKELITILKVWAERLTVINETLDEMADSNANVGATAQDLLTIQREQFEETEAEIEQLILLGEARALSSAEQEDLINLTQRKILIEKAMTISIQKAVVDLRKSAAEEKKIREELKKQKDADRLHEITEQKKFNVITFKADEKLYRKSFALAEKELAEKKRRRDENIQRIQTALATISTMTSSSNKALFAIGKASAIANAIISIQQGAAGALKIPPPPLGFALAAAVIAAGAVNIAKIASTSLAEGGIVLPRQGGTLARIGEAGKAEAVIPLDDPEAQERLGGILGGLTVNINAGVIVADDEGITALAVMLDEKFLELRQNSQAVSF